MRPFFQSSFCLAQYARRMYSVNSEMFALRTEYGHKRKAINLHKLLQADLLINKALGKNESINNNQWGLVRDELKQCENITDVNVDSQVYDICFFYNRIDQGINYFKFLDQNKYQLNLATMTTYLRLMALKKSQLTDEEQENIIRVYNKIKKEHEILDPRSAVYCIIALSLTKQWQECFKLLEMIKIIQAPGIIETSSIICAAFKNDRADLAWKMINAILVNYSLKPDVYIEYLNYCKRNFSKDKLVKEVEKMFLTWQKYHALPPKYVIDKYEEFFKSLGYTAKHTFITVKGVCCHCKNQLNQTLLTKGDFRILSSAILTNLIVGKDVYRNTSPNELKRYMIFLKTMKPYDVVIDGLNVAYSNNDADSKGLIENILQVVDYFHKRKKRTLVVGRIHMKWWRSRAMKALEDVTDVFYTKNISQDDPFLLHVTLSSGPNTCFVSRDYMRQHKYKIEEPMLQQLFKNWQMSHQYNFTKDFKTKRIKLIPPLDYHPTAQKNDEGWHVPYTTSTALTLPNLYVAPENWLCLKYKEQEKC